MTDLPFPLRGRVLLTGPTHSGKTTLTARALEAWIAANGPHNVSVIDLAPAYPHGDRVIGTPLDVYTRIPEGVWIGRLRSAAPRLEGKGPKESLVLAHRNHIQMEILMAAAPPAPAAVFVNDVTLAFHHPESRTGPLLEYGDHAKFALFNALESDELGRDDPISQREKSVLNRLRHWADTTVRLPPRNTLK